VPLRKGISIMPNLSTLEESVARGRTKGSHRTVLRVSRVWSLQYWARKLLRSALELLTLLWLVLIRLLTIASCLTPWTERNSRR
jgi:hypothetical protein